MLDDGPVLQHHHGVGVGDRLHAMGDDQNGPIALQRRQGLTHRLFGLRVGESGRFVEHQHGCVGEQCTRDRNPLCLTAGQSRLRIDHGVVSARQLENSIVDIRQPGGAHHVIEVGMWYRERDIVRDRRAQQSNILEDEGDHPIELPTADFAKIDTAEGDRTVRRIEEPRQKLNQRGLSAARRPDDRGDRPGRQHQVDPAQYLVLVVVTESNLAQFHPMPLWCDRVRGLRK